MREHTLSLKAQGGDRVSEAYLQAAQYRRAQSLVDDPTVPLFFGRIDVDTEEVFHIGRRHVMDAGSSNAERPAGRDPPAPVRLLPAARSRRTRTST
jgi:hypothetical protein